MGAQHNLLGVFRDLSSAFLSSVNIYRGVLPKSVSLKRQADAEKQVAALPLTDIPPPSPLLDGSRMPLRRNSRFVGRQDELRRLAAALKSGQTAVVCQTKALAGLEGIGKSELATEFAHRYGRFFSGGVFWLCFACPQAILAEVIACGGPDGLSSHPEIFNKLPWAARLRLVAAEWQSSLPVPTHEQFSCTRYAPI